MAGLTNKSIAATYQGLLKTIGDNVNIPTGSTGVQIVDGEETVTALYLTDGEVGMGTASPGAALDVSNASTQLRLSYDATNYASFNVAADGLLTITTVDPDGAEADIILAPDGNVGIGPGMTTPKSMLQIGVAQVTSVGVAAQCGLVVSQSEGSDASGNLTQIGFGAASNTNCPIAIGGRKYSVASTNGNDAFFIALRSATSDSVPTEKFTMIPGGNVGIGDTDPQEARLHVVESTAQLAFRVHQGHGGTAAMEVNHNDPDDEILINFQSEGVSKANISFDTSDDDVDYNKTSDERIKRNIRDADDLLSLVNSIEVKKYRKIGCLLRQKSTI